MILNATISSNKNTVLTDKYVELLDKGIDTSKILVIVQNSIQKNNFLKEVLEKTNQDTFRMPLIYSFNSLIYNTILDNWAYIENSLKGTARILPNQNGLEVTQYILKDILKDIKFKGYNSKKSLLHQIFRRYSLIVQNNLTDEDVKWRSEEVLKEGFAEDSKHVIHELLKRTLNYRSLDYLRQSLIFNHIYKHTEYFKDIEYLIINNADEMPPICIDFVEFLSKQLKDELIVCDELGSSRCGYLSANKNTFKHLQNIFKNSTVEKLETKSKLYTDAQTLYSNLINDNNENLQNFSYQAPSKRATMIDLALSKIKELINRGVKASEIAIITPIIDDMLKFQIKETIEENIATPLYISGSEKLIQNPLITASLKVIMLSSDLKENLTEYDIRGILYNLLRIPIKYTREILTHFEETKTLIEHDFKNEEYNEKYSKFLEVINYLENSNLCFSEKLLLIFNKFVNLSTSTTKEINRFSFCVKQIQDFENVFGKDFTIEHSDEILNQLENSIISENPYGILSIEDNNLIVSTPQKIIDNEIETKYQFWLDISSSEWIKNDIGPLYNAWVFQKDWEKEEYTVDDDIELSKQKNARVLRKLTLCAKEKIFTYSSLFDGLGVENFRGIEKYINYVKDSAPKYNKITPRKDQEGVLTYQKDKMAISAVPGAGKTTILLALIIKLLEKGIKPENIFVLTYMESAARNFRDRIKNICSDLTTLPNISTIHGLALRILKDNSNYERLNLPSDFEICDDTKRYSILQQISQKIKLKRGELEEFDRAISVAKHSKINSDISSKDEKIQRFLSFYKEYQNALNEENIIDYDDMLIMSVKLLEDNPDILKHYQEICEYVIEDEAQDSSAIQQKLIGLLSQKHKNLIRCGDINQSITTTFSNADVEGFRKFIKDSNKVEMNCSQRCARDVYKLANKLVDWAETNDEMKNAFYNIKMVEVEGKNPVANNSITSLILSNGNFEKNYILKQIRNLLSENPKSTIGILLRNNYQVSEWLKRIDDAGFKTISRSESLEQKVIFKVIFAILKIIEKPFDNNVLANSYEILAQHGYYKPRLQLEIKNSKIPFIEINTDEIENPDLSKFYWDISYWLTFSTLPMDELCLKIGQYYFSGEIEKSNVYLISTLIKRLMVANNGFTNVLNKFEELSKKSSLSGFKFFSENDENDSEYLKGKIQIMTMHKSKGDEFDYVFIPEFSEKNLSLNIDSMKLKGSSAFIENIKMLNPNYKGKTELDLKKEILEENLRLLYVAITRAKKKLYFTCSQKQKNYYGKEEKIEENIIFNELLQTKVIN